jgi:hypothetical protein
VLRRFGLDVLLNYEGVRIDRRLVRKEEVAAQQHLFATSKYRITGLSWRNGPEDCPLEGLHLFDCYEEITEPAVKMRLFRQKKPHVRRFVIFPVSNAHNPTLILDIPQKIMHKKVKVYDHQFHLIGKVRKVMSVTHAHMAILDPFLVEEKAEIYHIKSPRTPGWHRMHIYAPGARDEVGFIDKRAQGRTSFCRIGDADLDLRFPEAADSSERALLLSAALFTETLWFD